MALLEPRTLLPPDAPAGGVMLCTVPSVPVPPESAALAAPLPPEGSAALTASGVLRSVAPDPWLALLPACCAWGSGAGPCAAGCSARGCCGAPFEPPAGGGTRLPRIVGVGPRNIGWGFRRACTGGGGRARGCRMVSGFGCAAVPLALLGAHLLKNIGRNIAHRHRVGLLSTDRRAVGALSCRPESKPVNTRCGKCPPGVRMLTCGYGVGGQILA